MNGEILELGVASAEGVVGEGWEACVAKRVEVVRVCNLGKYAGDKVMAWHVQEVAIAC